MTHQIYSISFASVYPHFVAMAVRAGLNVHSVGDRTGVGFIEGAMQGAAEVGRLL